MFKKLQNFFSEKVSTPSKLLQGDFLIADKDLHTITEDLIEVVKKDPDTVELALALGNLFRAQGDLERAIRVRYTLLARPNLPKKLQTRAWLELGKDFQKSGFFDRATDAFENAVKVSGMLPEIMLEMASLSAKNKDYENAANFYEKLNFPSLAAHYLIRSAQLVAIPSKTEKYIKQALNVYPNSVEAWLEKVIFYFEQKKEKKVIEIFDKALKSIPEHLIFAFLEGFYGYAFYRDCYSFTGEAVVENPFFQIPVEIFSCIQENYPENDVLILYAAIGFHVFKDVEKSENLITELLNRNEHFFPAHLFFLRFFQKDLLENNHLVYFLENVAAIYRFECSQCGFKTNRLFFHCPCCSAWHSIHYRVEYLSG